MTENMIKAIITLLGVASTLGIYSILYKENKAFRFFEHLYLGLAAGYTIAATWTDVLKPNWWDPMTGEGKWALAFLFPAGMLFYLIYSKRNGWLARLIFGLFFGLAAGQAFQGFAASYWPKLKRVATIPLAGEKVTYADTLNNLLFLAILAAVMTYFFFSFEQKSKAIRGVSRFGRYAMMIAFGALFGNTIMARMALLIGRIYFLIHSPESIGLMFK